MADTINPRPTETTPTRHGLPVPHDGTQRAFMTLEDILRLYAPALYDSWEDWLQQAWTTETDRCHALLEDYQERGFFTDPIILTASYEDEDGEYPATVGNGYHRLAVHHRLAEQVPVWVQFGYAEEPIPPVDRILSLLVAMEPTATAEQGEEVFDALWRRVSWRHLGPQGDFWLTVEGSIGVPPSFEEFYLYVRPQDKHLVVPEAVAADVATRLRDLPVQVVSVYWRYVNEDYDDVDEEGNVLSENPRDDLAERYLASRKQ